MRSDDDEGTRYGLAVVAAVVGLVVVGVLAFAVGHLGRKPVSDARMSSPGDISIPTMMPHGGVFAPAEKLYFAIGSDQLPVDSDVVLARVAETVRAQNGVSVLISGFHDASGDPQANAELAKRRALAVRHALEANGVSPDLLVMSRPEMTAGGVDNKEARRVEMRLR